MEARGGEGDAQSPTAHLVTRWVPAGCAVGTWGAGARMGHQAPPRRADFFMTRQPVQPSPLFGLHFLQVQLPTVRQYDMENSGNKQVTGCKLCTVLSSVTESHRVPLSHWDLTRPFLQRLHAVHAPHRQSPRSHLDCPGPLSQYCRASVRHPYFTEKMCKNGSEPP